MACAKQKVADFTNGAKAARRLGRVGGASADGVDGVGDRERKTHIVKQGEIRKIVADESRTEPVDPEGLAKFVETRHFVATAEHDVADAEFPHAPFYGPRTAPADDSDFDAGA